MTTNSSMLSRFNNPMNVSVRNDGQPPPDFGPPPPAGGGGGSYITPHEIYTGGRSILPQFNRVNRRTATRRARFGQPQDQSNDTGGLNRSTGMSNAMASSSSPLLLSSFGADSGTGISPEPTPIPGTPPYYGGGTGTAPNYGYGTEGPSGYAQPTTSPNADSAWWWNFQPFTEINNATASDTGASGLPTDPWDQYTGPDLMGGGVNQNDWIGYTSGGAGGSGTPVGGWFTGADGTIYYNAGGGTTYVYDSNWGYLSTIQPNAPEGGGSTGSDDVGGGAGGGQSGTSSDAAAAQAAAIAAGQTAAGFGVGLGTGGAGGFASGIGGIGSGFSWSWNPVSANSGYADDSGAGMFAHNRQRTAAQRLMGYRRNPASVLTGLLPAHDPGSYGGRGNVHGSNDRAPAAL